MALDADDTLWHNEPLFTSVRDQFCAMLDRYQPEGIPSDWLDGVEMRNLQHFGYGVKGFVLSMIETAIEMTGGRLEARDVSTDHRVGPGDARLRPSNCSTASVKWSRSWPRRIR